MKAKLTKLFTLLAVLLFGIGNVWGTATNYHDFVAAGDTIIDIEGSGSTPSAKMTAINGTDWAAVSTSAKNNSIYRMDPSTEEVATSKTNVYGTKLGSSAKSTYKVKGVSNVIFYVGTGTADRIAKLDVTEDGKSKVSEAASVTLSNKNNAYKMSYALDASKSYTLEAYASADIFCYAVKFTVAAKASYTITYDKNGGDGTMDNSTNTVSACTFTAPTGKEFKEWNTQADGLGDTWAVGATATSDLDLFAIWQTKVEKFTVKYMDGTTELGSEIVVVGNHPTGSEIAAPTKDCYTFAGWDPALNTVSGDDGDEIEVNATWTPIYSSSATLISDDVVSGKPNVNTVFAASNIVSSITFASGNYEFTNNETKPGYYGYKDKQSGDYMKILVQQGKRVKVLFGNLGADPTITVNGVAKTLDAARTTGDMAENTFTWTASAEDALVSITMGSGTNTLKKVDINALYNATFTDGTGDASGSESSVAEVTLPTPSETTVGGSTFTGWKANQIVKVAGVDQAIGTDITAGTVVELTANTTFTAQWVTTSNYDVRFFPGYGPNEQIGTTQSISTGNYATPEANPSRAGYRFLGWSIDGTEANIKDVASYAITAATDFTAVWIQQFEVTFNLQGYGSAIAAQNVDNGGKVSRPVDPIGIGQTFGGWFKESTCDNEWDFATDVVTEATELFAKWTAFGGCIEIYPATSGSALNVGDNVDLISGSHGGSIAIVGMKTAGSSILYDSYGLKLSGGSADVISVTLTNEMIVGTKINVKLVSVGTGSRGLNLLNETGGSVAGGTMLGWTSATNGAVETFSYTVTASDGLDGKNVFRLQRNNTVVLSCVTIESCGSALIFHNLTSAITPDHDPAYATVTLGASSVREGLTTTATYSAIDAGYEFDEWQISGTDAAIDDAHANPVTITMGTADAVITLKLKVATVKHNVTFNTHGGSAVAAQEVEDGGHAVVPTAPTREDYIFQGWAEVEDGAIVDVTSFAITADKEFHAIWVAEPAGIKLINGDGSINTTNFTTGVTAGTVNFDDADHNCAAFGSTGGTIVGLTGLNKVVAYNATTTQTRVKFILYNTNSSEKELYLQKVLEGATEAVTETIAVPSKERHETIYYTYNSSDLRSFYVTVNSTNIKILQMKVIEDGTVLKRAGETGYELNLNQGRVFGAQNEAITFEGLAFTPSSNAKVLNSTELQIKTPLSFTIAAPLTLTVTTSSAKYYVSQNAAEDGTTATAVTAAGTEEFNLVTTGTWYIVPSTTSAVKLTNIAFSAPKCAEPAFNALDNSELCEGDPFDALDGTATVADAGVPTYQWYNADGDVEIDGATSATYTPSADGSYYVIATNHLAGYADNAKQSATVTVTHFASASITTAPVNVRETVGTDATLTVVAAGKNLGYAWYTCDDELGTNPVVIPGETAASLTITVTAGLNQYYKVLVSSDCGSASAVAKIEEWTELPQVNVSATTTWDWTNAATENIKLTDATTPAKNAECLMANINIEGKKPTNDATFNSQALLFYGENVRNIEGGRTYASVGHIKFTTTVSGMVEVEFSDNGSNNRRLNVNGNLSESSASKTDVKTFTAFVSAGDVTIMGVEEDGTGSNRYVRISKIIFTVKTTPDYIRSVTNNIGTLCVDHNVPAGGAQGATFYQIAGKNAEGKLVFEEVTSLNAGEPYVFQSTTGGITLYYGEDVEPSPVEYKGMVGSFSDKHVDIDDSNKTNIMYIASNKLWDCSDLTPTPGYLDVVANRAYIFNYAGIGSAPAHAPGKRYIVVGRDAAQGFDQLDASETPMKLIIDGQLFILRGEKMYNANGQLVK